MGHVVLLWKEEELFRRDLTLVYPSCPKRTDNMLTDIWEATRQNDIETVRYLLENDVNPNETNSFGETPLHLGGK